MIYTITFNPAVDLVMSLEQLNLGELNRVPEQHFVAGGKGINMSVLLKRLGLDSVATGFIGGFSGQFIIDELASEGIASHFIAVDGQTRINTKLKADRETEINGAGPIVTQADLAQLTAYLEETLTAEDVIFLAGNTARGMDEAAYQAVAAVVKEGDARLVIDTNRQLLSDTLQYEPFLIKPNEQELADIVGQPIESKTDIIKYARELQHRGAQHVLVSRGGDGAILLTESGAIYEVGTPSTTHRSVVNSVGAGDSMLAGFMAQYLATEDMARSLQFAAACGSATAYSTGIATRELIEELVDDITVTQLDNLEKE